VEITQRRYRGGGSLRRLLSTRRGTALVAGSCTLVAAAILGLALASYRHSVSTPLKPETVFVASTLIQRGTSGNVISTGEMFRAERIAPSRVSAGAIADMSMIRGKVAAADIRPGQQLTLGGFVAGDGIMSQLAPAERAISIPLDSSHGLGGVVHPGDRVDVYAGLDASLNRTGGSADAGVALKLLLRNVPVLSVNATGSGIGSSNASSTSNVVLKVKADDAGALAFASDNGKVWLVLRGANARGPDSQSHVTYTLNSLLLGSASAGNGGKR
jgi:Flp pilus assembly protein CpaB